MMDLETQCKAHHPEDNLLILCARSRVDGEEAARMRNLLKDPMDWDYLLHSSSQHGLQPFLYRQLALVCPEKVPEATLERLAYLYQENSVRNHRLTGELFRILDLFESEGIPAVPFKGPVLAAQLYRDLALRQCDDLDILVLRQDVMEAEKLLMTRGYRPELNLSPKAKMDCLNIHDEYGYRRENPSVTVEIHWQILPRYHSIPFDLSSLLQQDGHKDPSGQTVLTLQPEVLLLLLCLHGYRHRWERLCWLRDISQLVHQHTELNWESVLCQAADLRCRRIFLLGLCLAQILLGTDLPADIASEIQKDNAVKKLGLEVAGILLRGNSSHRGLLALVWFQLRAREEMQDRIRYCYRSVLSATLPDYLHMDLPRSLTSVYPLFRPFRLARKYAPW